MTVLAQFAISRQYKIAVCAKSRGFLGTDRRCSVDEMPTVRAVIGRFVRDRRGKRVQEEFGKDVKISQSTISALENGARGLRVVHLESILDALNIPAVSAFQLLLDTAKKVAEEEEKGTGLPIEAFAPETTKRGAVNPSKAKFVAGTSESKKKPKQMKKKPPSVPPESTSEEQPRRPSRNS